MCLSACQERRPRGHTNISERSHGNCMLVSTKDVFLANGDVLLATKNVSWVDQNMQNSGHSMSTGVARGGPHGGAPPGAMQGAVPGQGPPIRVRQAFKWAYNLRKKSIDKSRILAPQYTVMLPSGLDVHTAMVVLDPQKGPRLGTEHDQSPCKPEAHQVQQHPDLLEVIFKRRSTSQQATVFVDSVCTKCLQCFFVTDGGPTRPPQQQPAGAPGAQGPQAGKPGSYGAISGGLHHNYAQAPGWAQQQRAPASMHAAQHAQQQTGARHPALSQQQAVASSPAQQQAASRQPQQQVSCVLAPVTRKRDTLCLIFRSLLLALSKQARPHTRPHQDP